MLQLGTISEVALIFASSDDFERQVNQALARVGEALGASRSYLFLAAGEGGAFCPVHAWEAPGLADSCGRRLPLPAVERAAWEALLAADAGFVAADLDELPGAVRAGVEPAGVRALAVMPLRRGHECLGFLGLDDCAGPRQWSALEREILRTIAGLVCSACDKKRLADRLAASEGNFRHFFNSLDDVVVIADAAGRLVYANHAAARKLGHAPEGLVGRSLLDLYPGEGREAARRLLAALGQGGEDWSPRELLTRDGRRLPVATRLWAGRWNGESCLFGVSRDISAEQAARQKFEALFRHNPAAMAVSHAGTGAYLDVNDTFASILGYSREELLGHSGRELNLFLDPEAAARARDDIAREGRMRQALLDVRHRDGSLRKMLCTGEAINAGGERYLVTVMNDMTEKYRLQAELRAAHDRQKNILDGARLGAWEWHVPTDRLYCNDRSAAILGHTLAELEPSTLLSWRERMHPEDRVEAEQRLARHFAGAHDVYEHEFRMRHRDGTWVWVLARGKVFARDDQGRPLRMYGIHSDITVRKQMEEQIRDLAIRDPLTGLHNRRYVMDRLQELLGEYRRDGRDFCIALIDIDFFKKVNDVHGHQGGDLVLQEFARLVEAGIRPYDILARYGGEEFILVAPGARAEGVSHLVERLMATVRDTALPFAGRRIRFTFSCGIADSSELDPDEASVPALVARADERLYAAKAGGRDCWVGPA